MTLPPEDPDSFTRHNSAPLVPQDYISVLTKVIEEATRDPVQLRNLVYALASNFLKPERKTTNPSSDTWQQAAAMFQLEHARRELERAIEAIEKDAAYRTQASRGAGHEVNPPPSQELPSANPLQSLHDQLREVEANPSEEASPPAHPAVSGDNAVIILPERAPSWLVQNSTNRLSPHYGQPWDQRFQSTLDAHVYAPAQRRVQIGLLPFVQLVAAAFIGVVIYVGVAGWIQTQQKATPPAIATPIALPVETVRAPDLVEAKIGAPKINVSLPFPVPRSYGVYAAGDGQLVELSQLPIRVPDFTCAIITRNRTAKPLHPAHGRPVFRCIPARSGQQRSANGAGSRHRTSLARDEIHQWKAERQPGRRHLENAVQSLRPQSYATRRSAGNDFPSTWLGVCFPPRPVRARVERFGF